MTWKKDMKTLASGMARVVAFRLSGKGPRDSPKRYGSLRPPVAFLYSRSFLFRIIVQLVTLQVMSYCFSFCFSLCLDGTVK